MRVREGGIRYLDEVVEARKDTTVVIHPLADDRRVLPIDRTGEQLQAPDGFMLVMSYNPGYQNFLKGLKPSTRQRLSRCASTSRRANARKRSSSARPLCDPMLARQLVSIARSLRALKDVDLDEVVSTRLFLVYAAKLVKVGLSPIEACRRRWSRASPTTQKWPRR